MSEMEMNEMERPSAALRIRAMYDARLENIACACEEAVLRNDRDAWMLNCKRSWVNQRALVRFEDGLYWLKFPTETARVLAMYIARMDRNAKHSYECQTEDDEYMNNRRYWLTYDAFERMRRG